LIDEANMKCHQIENKLSAYQDGELSASENEQVERHLAGCHACREQHVKLQQTWKALGEIAEIRPTPGFYERVSQKIDQAPERRVWDSLWGNWRLKAFPSPAIASAILAIGIISGAIIGNSFVDIHPPQSATVYAEEGFLSSLRVFGPVPPGTLADNYERLLSYNEGHMR
jgi:anti-sigma factor RsiW